MDRHAAEKSLHQGEVTLHTRPTTSVPSAPVPVNKWERPRVGITIGDPAGVGPELIRQAVLAQEIQEIARLQIIGKSADHTPGQPTLDSARAALEAIEESVRLLKSGEIEAIVTCPISKSQMAQVGFQFPGHTEFYAAHLGASEYSMILTSPSLTVSPVTIHVPLSEAVRELNVEAILRVGRLLADFLMRTGKDSPVIGVAGLNPHAGEDGLLGEEEGRIIRPAVEKLCRLYPGARFVGPESPDTVFYRAVKGEFDAVLGMYHDQALIPLKLIGFHDGVNVTAGLPFPRTSPDHGTAFNIAGRGVACPDSLFSAIRLAARLAYAGRSFPSSL